MLMNESTVMRDPAQPFAVSHSLAEESLRLISEGFSYIEHRVRRYEGSSLTDIAVEHVVGVDRFFGGIPKNRPKRMRVKNVVRRNRLFLIVNRHFKYNKRRAAVPDRLK